MSWLGQSPIPNEGKDVFPEEELAVIEKVARKVVERGMTVPAIIFLESVKPLNFISAQAMIFFEPMVQTIFNLRDYDAFRSALEKRPSIELLIQKIEAMDAEAQTREKRIKSFMKAERKKWNWYQRYLGIFPPKVVIPDAVLNPPGEPRIEQKKNDGQ
jgi:hypothetical protein